MLVSNYVDSNAAYLCFTCSLSSEQVGLVDSCCLRLDTLVGQFLDESFKFNCCTALPQSTSHSHHARD